MNTQAIEVNKLSDRPILSRIHGIYSIGALTGAGLLSLLLRAGLPLLASVLLIAAGLALIALTQTRHLLPPAQDEADTPLSFRHVRGRILLLGGLCALLFMCEGSVLDWSAVFLRQYRDFDVSLAGLGYTAFAVMMTIARFTGDRMVMRFGEEPMLRYGVLTAIAGLLIVIILPWQASSLAGFGLVGFGIANTVPIVFAASSRVSNLPSKIALPLVTMLGCGGVLFGPVLIGYIAQLITLPLALAVLATVLALVAWQAKAIRA